MLEASYFDLDDEAFGSFSLDIKLQDTFGITGNSTSLTNVIDATTGHTRSLTVGPSVQAQATYDNVLWFAIPQNANVRGMPEIDEDEALSFARVLDPATEKTACYRATVQNHTPDLALGKYRNLELFDRILVDARQPLAAWLLENGKTMGVSRNILSDVHAKSEGRKPVPVLAPYIAQSIDGGQLAYTFTVQYTGGIDAKFSLVSSRFNPLNADLSAGIQQTGALSIFVNGYQAATSIGAKGGLIAIESKAPQPTEVVIVGDETKPRGKLTQAEQDAIVTQVTTNKKPSIAASDTAFGDLRTELQKDQTAAGQAARTEAALSKFGLSETVQQSIASQVQRIANETVIRPRVVTVPSNAPRTVQENNGRGIFRYPLGFPLQ